MSEQIIIDGIDVSKCAHFRKVGNFSNSPIFYNACAEHVSCYCKGKPCAFKCIKYAQAYKKLMKIYKELL